jgi:predicted SnoaL-like aldol condensation-catalyzing enzyme
MSTPPSAERLDRFTEAWLRCELDELREFLTPDAVYSPLSGELVRGREAVVRRFAELLAEEETRHVHFAPPKVSGSLGTCRWHLLGQTPDGTSFEIEGVDVYRFEGDLIRSKDSYRKA